MPSFRKLSAAEVAVLDLSALGARAQVAQTYDAELADFSIGDYGQVELQEGEPRAVVRQCLQAAALRRGFVLRFRSGPGLLTFRVDVGPVQDSSVPAQEPVAAVIVAPTFARHTPPAGKAPLVVAQSSRPPRRRQSATERYHEMLPRWMRVEQPSQRRAERKRPAR
jgi:hypothetical protein